MMRNRCQRMKLFNQYFLTGRIWPKASNICILTSENLENMDKIVIITTNSTHKINSNKYLL